MPPEPPPGSVLVPARSRLRARGTAQAATAAFCMILAAAAAAQTRPDTRPAPPENEEADRRPASWPRLTEAQRQEAGVLIHRLITQEDEEAEAAWNELLGMGAGVAPLAIMRFADGEDRANELLAAVVDRYLDAGHAPLLARHLTDRRVSVKRFAAARLSRFPERSLRRVYQRMRGDEDGEIALQGELALAGIGDIDALDALVVAAGVQWRERWREIHRASRALKGEKATAKLVALLGESNLRTRLAALRLLAGAGTRDAVAPIAPMLDASDHILKKEAINALRGILDGALPIEDLSVFEGIEMARSWKRRLGG